MESRRIHSNVGLFFYPLCQGREFSSKLDLVFPDRFFNKRLYSMQGREYINKNILNIKIFVDYFIYRNIFVNNFNTYQVSMGDRFSNLFSSIYNVAQYIFYAMYRAKLIPDI